MRHRMVIENLSPRTIRSYMHYPLKLAEYFNAVPQDLTTDEIYAFLVYLKEDRGLSRSTMRIAVSGIRYFFQHILKRSSIIDDVPYPKKEKYLPEILSGKGVKRLFVLTKNIKHKALLMLAYSAGLRRGEIIGLRLVDIDRKNMQLNIRKGKGNKDRKAILSRYLLGVLEQYYQSYHPEVYLFNGRKKSEPISEGAVNWTFRHAIKRTGIKKDLSLHSLRHSFASHLLSMGGHLWHCHECGHEHISYNACRNRHCPKCNGLRRIQWVQARKAEAMPGGYAHIVFTLPHDLNDLCREYPHQMYTLLFMAAWETMETFAADRKHLGARTGMVAVLHTWGQNLMLHPHVHCLVPMGGLSRQGKWKQARSKGKFLFPVKAMSKIFRGKFTDGLYRLDQKGDIMLAQPIDPEQKHLHPLYRRKWVVFAKRPVAGNEKAIEYIGRYAHRIAIANSRIREVTDEKVTFSWVDYRHSKTSDMQLDGVEFLRRFVEHIMPQGFVKIRHYGILSNRLKSQALDAAYRNQDQQRPEKLPAIPWFELIEMFCGKDPLLCPKCKKARLSMIAQLPPKRAGPDESFTLNTGFYRVA